MQRKRHKTGVLGVRNITEFYSEVLNLFIQVHEEILIIINWHDPEVMNLNYMELD